jgi:hypothetical protein
VKAIVTVAGECCASANLESSAPVGSIVLVPPPCAGRGREAEAKHVSPKKCLRPQLFPRHNLLSCNFSWWHKHRGEYIYRPVKVGTAKSLCMAFCCSIMCFAHRETVTPRPSAMALVSFYCLPISIPHFHKFVVRIATALLGT